MKLSGKQKIAGLFVISVVALALVAGCGLIGGSNQKAAKEEQELLGAVDTYNPKIQGIQIYLYTSGYGPGSTDGIMNGETRKAIKDFQKANQLRATGYLNLETLERLTMLQQEELGKPAAMEASGTVSIEPAVPAEVKPEQISLQEVRERLKSSSWVKKVQAALSNAGFDPGPIDGKMGKKTEKAVMDFQAAKGLKADGKIGPKTWSELSKYFPKETVPTGSVD